ncbi:sensor histidine kinase [Parathalassolituus penaei]|uniref:histidine kinase n=1 Tax=Parathalassolituus penaei TaxID=2997323 RepID=A0A9X3EH58_9GAMM|nr:ATP-binding protein [Parathalassolituus penaei]MCY0966664.1 ATP-binding protein [Parathalassolituus penaei]
MYKKKLFLFGLLSGAVLLVALAGVALSAHITRANLQQSMIAQSLLTEHQQLSSISYRLFKQLTDELIFGRNANQALVRKKQELIDQSLRVIRELELRQREALGPDLTQGSVEDTDELEKLLTEIIVEFRAIIDLNDATPLRQQERLQRLLEVTIDNQFREAINAAVTRQSRMVAATNARIDTLNTALMWFTILLATLAGPFIVFGCVWLFNQLYQPLTVIQTGTQVIASGDYHFRLPENLDSEFHSLVQSLNQLAARLAEHELQQEQQHQQLQFEVEQRTRELTEANHQLTLQDARRKQFMADVSHELRTPLTIIRGEAQVTLRQPQLDEQTYRQTLQVILDQSVNLSRLVDDLLLLARAEMSQLKLNCSSVDLVTLLQQQARDWQRLHPARHIDCVIAPNLGSTLLQADEQRLQQVIAILMDNATRYSPTQTPVTLQLGKADGRFMIQVIDQGEGISTQDLPHIFERFVRFKPKTEGTGLGLAIARVIAIAHQGDIRVTSAPGQGSTFTLVLPETLLS